ESLKRVLGRVRSAAEAVNPVTDESAALERRCREIAAQVEFISRADDENFVYWTETRGRSVVLSASPVDVSRLLGDTLFSTTPSAILTPATLPGGGRFALVRARLA